MSNKEYCPTSTLKGMLDKFRPKKSPSKPNRRIRGEIIEEF